VDADHPGLLEDYRSQLPRSYLAFGFTTLVDLNAKPATLAWFNRAPLHPDYYHCGQAVEIVGGYPSFANPKDKAEADRVNLVYDPAQSEHWPAALDRNSYTPADAVRRAADAGAICVKVFVEHGFGGAAHWPVPSRQTLDALRAASVARGLVFVVHANAVESWRAALDAHADVIAHGLWHWPGDLHSTTPPVEARTVIRRAAASHVAVQPTLQAVFGDESIFDRSILRDPRLAESLPPTVLAWLTSGEGEAAARSQAEEYRSAIARMLGPIGEQKAMSIAPSRAMATLRLMLGDHVRLLFGTDTPSNEGIGNPPGLNGRLELGRWAEAGVPLGRILRAATVDNAKAFHLSSDVGTIEVGKRADLLLLRSDPLKTIHAYDTIDTVFLNGVRSRGTTS
ncbi:MAG TPA: amidohydrolase family protein, partial [Thermoanaerobaculia bacterium]